ncbi:MAG: HAD family hydrolase [Sedimentisphaerales bacterium]|nr:HAD family hydrolase [Sedimentisphaerales bacterium]
MITTVVFDLDDTLYDEINYCRSGFLAVSRFLARVADVSCSDDVFACLWRHFTSGNRTRTFNAALKNLGIGYGEALIAQLVEVYRFHCPAIELPADSRAALDQLSGAYTLALLTDGYLPAQRLKVEALGLERYFQDIVYTEELGREFWKPSPAGFERLIETLGVSPAQMAYVADNEAKDFIAPNHLGMLTVRITRPACLHTAVGCGPGAAAKVSIERLSELSGTLRGV